ncbi:MAG: HlyD family secretion protein [Planctomycetota bacterium]|jgi:multidrug efflux pump subunit AcrA (membrane-fusion protein)
MGKGRILGALILLAACGRDEPAAPGRARPVTVLELAWLDAARQAYLTGSAEPHREEEIGFEVAGRVGYIASTGSEVEGPLLGNDDEELRSGTLIARLDPTRYRLALQALEAKIKANRKNLEAQRIELEQVAQADLEAAEATLRAARNEVTAAAKDVEAAEAALRLAEANLARARDLLRKEAGTQQDVDTAQSQAETALARKDQAVAALEAKRGASGARDAAVTTARASIGLKRAQLEATEAQIEELEQNRKQAQRDLADCDLRAPFRGRITKLHVAMGAIVSAGAPVLTLTLIDPIKVSVSVSAEADRYILPGSIAELLPNEPPEVTAQMGPLYGAVFEKPSVADPATRTFRIDLVVRNQRRRPADLDPALEGLPTCEFLLPAITRYHGEGGPLYVDTGCLFRDGDRHYVLRLPGFNFGTPTPVPTGKQVPERVFVVPAAERFRISRWTMRRLADAAELEEGNFLIMAPEGVQDPFATFKDGIALGQPTWRLRPGELVPVVFGYERVPPGFYVPIHAIRTLNEEHFVFVVESGRARRVPVKVRDTFKELRRIEGAGLAAGARIVVQGIHYVGDGTAVTVVGSEAPE